MTLKIPPPIQTEAHTRLAELIQTALHTWHRYLIGIDGVEGSGKSTMGRYLAWRLGIPVVETDMFLVPGSQQLDDGAWLQYRLPDLRAVIHARLDRNRPVIVEGLCLLHTLEVIGLSPDYIVYVREESTEGGITFQELRTRYTEQYAPLTRANEILTWRQRPPDL